jgi:hypothetical protein
VVEFDVGVAGCWCAWRRGGVHGMEAERARGAVGDGAVVEVGREYVFGGGWGASEAERCCQTGWVGEEKREG